MIQIYKYKKYASIDPKQVKQIQTDIETWNL